VPLEREWVRAVDRQCIAAGVPHHFKQWGHTIPVDQIDPASKITVLHGARAVFKDEMGRLLDGRERNGFPL